MTDVRGRMTDDGKRMAEGESGKILLWKNKLKDREKSCVIRGYDPKNRFFHRPEGLRRMLRTRPCDLFRIEAFPEGGTLLPNRSSPPILAIDWSQPSRRVGKTPLPGTFRKQTDRR